MNSEKKVSQGRGGNRHPLSVTRFILEHLAISGEDYIANMHRVYKFMLDTLAAERLRKKPYHKPSYHSFEVKVLGLVREGKVEFSEREENSDSSRVKHQQRKPVRRYYRLKQ